MKRDNRERASARVVGDGDKDGRCGAGRHLRKSRVSRGDSARVRRKECSPHARALDLVIFNNKAHSGGNNCADARVLPHTQRPARASHCCRPTRILVDGKRETVCACRWNGARKRDSEAHSERCSEVELRGRPQRTRLHHLTKRAARGQRRSPRCSAARCES